MFYEAIRQCTWDVRAENTSAHYEFDLSLVKKTFQKLTISVLPDFCQH